MYTFLIDTLNMAIKDIPKDMTKDAIRIIIRLFFWKFVNNILFYKNIILKVFFWNLRERDRILKTNLFFKNIKL